MEIKIDSAFIANGKLRWAKLNPTNPGKGYDPGSTEWAFDFLPSEKLLEAFKTAGLEKLIKYDKEDIPYFKLTRSTTKKDGTPMPPFPVVDKNVKPWDWQVDPNIGNGTTANVKLKAANWTYGRKSGISLRCDGVQILELVGYGPQFEPAEMDGGEAW